MIKRRTRNRMQYYQNPINEGTVKTNKYIGVTIPFNNPKGIFYQSKTNATQIYSNIRNLLLTTKGERYMVPDFGTNLKYILFENITSEEEFTDRIKTDIRAAFVEWMPFITLEKISVDINPDYAGLKETDHAIKIDFTAKIGDSQIYLPLRLVISTVGRIEIEAIQPQLNYR